MSPDAYVDLHLHTLASDGVSPAEEVVAEASRARLVACAITDHDTVDALPAAQQAATRHGLRLIPGIEISTGIDGTSVHILGYYFDPDHAGFQERLQRLRGARDERARRMVVRLQELGMRVSLERVLEVAAGAPVGRPHVAQVLLDAGHVKTFQEAFDRYLGQHAPAYVSRTMLTPLDAIEWMREAGGVAVLAHPGPLGRDDLIRELAGRGLVGLEVWHPRHGEERRRHYGELARELDLIATGGSDYHGGVRGESKVGDQPVPVAVLDQLERRCGPR